MDHIDLDALGDLDVSLAWEVYAAQALYDVETQADSEARKTKLKARWNGKSNQDCWAPFKEAMKALGGERCWYCESRFGRQIPQIDHFRPKSRALDRDRTRRLPDGYWWLAFDYRNFRVSCARCNFLTRSPRDDRTRGKGAYFPLVDESVISTPETNLGDEEPVLLDPCVEGDCALLEFDLRGNVAPAPGVSETPRGRAEESILRYDLDEADLISRRRQVILGVESDVRDWEDALGRLQSAGGMQNKRAAAQRCSEAILSLRWALEVTSDYRSIVRRYLRGRLKTTPVLLEQLGDALGPSSGPA